MPIADPSVLASYHTYGHLWVPATPSSVGYVQNYLDGVPIGVRQEWGQYQDPLTASASFATTDNQIHLATSCGSSVAPGWTVIDTTNNQYLGVVSACIGNLLTLATTTLSFSQGSNDVLVLTASPMIQHAAAPFAVGDATITMATSAPSWVQPGYVIFDLTNGGFVGFVGTGWVGNTLTLQSPSALASAGANDVLTFAPGDNLHLNTIGIIDTEKMAVEIAGSPDTPMQIKRLRVWQASAASNITH